MQPLGFFKFKYDEQYYFSSFLILLVVALERL